MRIRRSQFFFLQLRDESELDLKSLLAGEIRQQPTVALHALSAVGDTDIGLSGDELHLLLSLSAEEWTDLSEIEEAGIDPSLVERLAEAGLILRDPEPADAKGPDVAHRVRDEQLLDARWPRVAALFHRVSQWSHRGLDEHGNEAPQPSRDIELSRRRAEDAVRKYLEEHGPPPPAVVEPREGAVCRSLPAAPPRHDALFEALSRRRSCRTFDDQPLLLEDFSLLLRWAFGCHGWIELGEGYRLQHKTSPSGGGMHPIEAYPLVTNVEGLEPGLYHYGPTRHDLSRIEELDERQARSLATDMAAGQEFMGEASALVILAARFRRNFWKYPRTERSYSVIHQDLGHLSQTFYLLAARLGWGAIYTGAVSSDLISTRLALDPMEEGPLGICACGIPREDSSSWVPIRPHEPA